MNRVVIGFVLLFLSIFTHSQNTYAADTFEVSADNSNAKIIEDNRYLIPVNLYDNSGIMGFRVTLNYDGEKIRIISISKGLITGEGNFVTNISDADGTADIIWNNTADVKIKDGSLFFITAAMLSDDLTIDMSFSQPDTFNERYQDVCLRCEKIEIKKDVPAKIDNEKLAGLEGAAKLQYEDISSEPEAEEKALTDYIKNKDEEIDIPESEDKFKEEVILQSKKKGDKAIQDISDIPDDEKGGFARGIKEYFRNSGYGAEEIVVFKKLIAIILTIIALTIVFICHKKYVTENMEGKNEEEK